MKLSELKTALTAIGDSIDAANAQLDKDLLELKNALTDVEVPADATAAIDRLTAGIAAAKSKSQAIDDLNPDKPS